MNRYFAGQCSERDFVLCALAEGARIGYDESGTTWAIVDESQVPAGVGEITFLPTPRIGEVCLPSGDVLEWQQVPIGDPRGACFYLRATDPWMLVYSRVHSGWAVDAEGDTSDLRWSPTPTDPADRIEDYTRATLELRAGYAEVLR